MTSDSILHPVEMSLTTLPAELRLRIYEYIPELLPNVHHNIPPHSPLTPAICRASTVLRRETLPIYAADSRFQVCIDDSPGLWNRRIDCWISALGPVALSRIGSLQLSRNWRMLQPQRWQGHVGFYIRIDNLNRASNVHGGISSTSSRGPATDVQVVEWRGLKVMTGTYPVYV